MANSKFTYIAAAKSLKFARHLHLLPIQYDKSNLAMTSTYQQETKRRPYQTKYDAQHLRAQINDGKGEDRPAVLEERSYGEVQSCATTLDLSWHIDGMVLKEEE